MSCDASAYPLIFGKDSDNIPNKFIEADSIGLGTVTANLFVSAGADIATLFSTVADTTLSQEQVEDYAGTVVVSGGTKTGIALNYSDTHGTMDFVVDDIVVDADTGSDQNVTPGETLRLQGGTNVTTAASGTNIITINATDTNTTYSVTDGELSEINFTSADHTKLNAIEAAADVTDATNVNAAGALMLSDSTTAGLGIVIDEDNMATDSATKVPTQQSVKAYVDAKTLAESTYGDGETLDFGTGIDSKIVFDGTDTVWNPRATGTGNLIVSGGAWLGIGEISPEADLHVSGGQQVVAVFENNTASAAIAVAGTSTSAVITASSTNTAITNTAAGDMHFLTNNAYVMTLENGGKVGIGTTDPGQKLDVMEDTAGSIASIRADNQDNSNTGSDARYIAKVAGSSGGDPYMKFMIQGGQAWCIGLANAASDTFRIADHGTLDSNVALEIDTSQNVWMKTSLAIGQESAADNDAILELVSTTKAFLPPKMTTTQRNLITGAAGLTIYNTTTNKLQCHNGSGWQDCF